MSEQKKPRKKKPRRPSYEEGELRDKSIEKLADPNYQKSDLMTLIRKAANSRRKPPSAQ